MIEIIINDRCMYYSFLSIFKFSRICLGAEENLEIRFFKKCLELPDIERKLVRKVLERLYPPPKKKLY